MCEGCKHWLISELASEKGTLFAPCALKPPRRVPDPRMSTGFDIEFFTMASNYSCPRFARRPAE